MFREIVSSIRTIHTVQKILWQYNDRSRDIFTRQWVNAALRLANKKRFYYFQAAIYTPPLK